MNEARIAPFINQIFTVTGEFGEERPTHTHCGLDIAIAGANNKLYSMLDGIVIYNRYDESRGNYIIIKGDSGIATSYLHMRFRSPLNVGDRVSVGDEVGIEGNTGDSEGIHLHLEMQDLTNRNWRFSLDINDYMNPADFMEIDNIEGRSYIYNGTPRPYTNKRGNKFPWVLYANSLREKRNI